MASIIVSLEEIEADRHLIMFKTYEDYLDSLVTCEDLKNLRSTFRARIIAELGYRYIISGLFYRQLILYFLTRSLPAVTHM